MDEVKSVPIFSLLKPKKVVRTYEKEIECLRNPGHKKYKITVNLCDDGIEYPEGDCPLCEQEKEDARKEQQKTELLQHYKDCNIEPEYYGKTLKDYETKTPTQADTLKAAEDILNHKLGKLILLGTHGVGKSMIASILANEMNGKIYSMYEISTMIRQSYTARSEKSELEIVNELASIPFLAIDEVGRTNGSNSELNWLSYILDKRHVRKLPFMLITNGHLRKNCPNGGCNECFENYMDSDVISRLRQNSKVINIVADDYRARKQF